MMIDEVSRKMGRGLGLLVLRVGIGLMLMFGHGLGKVENIFAGKFDFGDPIGIGPELSLILSAGAEFVLAGCVLLGLGTRVSAAIVVFNLMVAAFLAHADMPFGKRELALLYGLVFLVITLTGPGRFSLDALLWPAFKRRQERKRKA